MTSSLTMYQELVSDYLAFRSISTDPTYTDDCVQTAEWLRKLFVANGCDAQSITGYGHPLVYAHYVVNPGWKTVLVYGHYDVQPASADEGWTSDPFVATYRDDRLYARGSTDNKGQTLIHLVSIFEHIRNNTLGYNIKFLIEGDEETGSPHLEQFLRDHHDLLAHDIVMISDGEMIGNSHPTMVASFRGGMNATITLQTATTDLHSGIYGNIVPSASHEAAMLVQKIHTANHMIAIPHRYDSLTPPNETAMSNAEAFPFDEEAIKIITGVKTLQVAGNAHPVIARGLMPTIQISGISSGYTGNGYKNIIPGSATIKCNCRFGPGQDPQTMKKIFTDWIERTIPDYVTHTLSYSDPYGAIVINTDTQETRDAQAILTEVFGHPVSFHYCGAAVPISGMFQDQWGSSVLMVDLGNDDCNMHGVDENIDMHCVRQGLLFSARFFGEKDGNELL